MNDYVSMNAPVVELLTKEDLALALHFLNPTLPDSETKSLYKKGEYKTGPCPFYFYLLPSHLP